MVCVRKHVENLDPLGTISQWGEQRRVACHRNWIAAHQNDDRRIESHQRFDPRPAEPRPRRVGDDDIDRSGTGTTRCRPTGELRTLDRGTAVGQVVFSVGRRET